MSLLQNLQCKHRDAMKSKGIDWCVKVAIAANLENEIESIRCNDDPVMALLNRLDSKGYSSSDLKRLIREVDRSATAVRKFPYNNSERDNTPSIKVALLIGNKNYAHWPQLVTPESDCRRLEKILQSFNFITVTVLNYTSSQIRKCIKEIFELVPPDAYCFIYYAGHGIEVGGTRKYILGIECPEVDCSIDNGVSEHYIIRNSLSCKPKLSVILFDMCRQSPTKELHPQLFNDTSVTEEYACDCNLLIGYSTSPFMMTFEKKHKPSEEDENRQTVCCDSGCTFNLGKNMSLYVEYLVKYLSNRDPIRTVLDLVQREFNENDRKDIRQQRPQKLDNTSTDFYLSHKITGDRKAESLLKDYIIKLNESSTYSTASTRQVR